jgi:hypothetical protein
LGGLGANRASQFGIPLPQRRSIGLRGSGRVRPSERQPTADQDICARPR